ncbi:hypothetical protein BDN72DRAFT_824638 [Pluteus cervinus]|uniref:Uncharacterized protein n=1 Tax=Pluteus cervinus TaxID=181527 RepID=A0ACD3AIG8_9AGAR|nr:hypothetical protein BDN72DRAFT_824638 [Pluteus cervinus]
MSQNTLRRGHEGFDAPLSDRDPEDDIWRENYDWLEAHGYQLRRRWHPDWVPSWEASPETVSRFSCEDSHVPLGALADGSRLSDGKLVMIKHLVLPASANELDLVTHLNSGPYSAIDENYSVPVYDVLRPPRSTDSVFIVMPLLRSWAALPFETLGEVIGFCQQAFTGLLFMHRMGTAHCDCKWNNILVDGSPLFDEEPHPIMMWRSRDFSRYLWPYSRTRRPVRYYWIDFGLSYRHHPATGPPSISTLACGDRSIPEQFTDPPWDPFALDVYCVGNILKDHSQVRRVNARSFSCLLPLLDDMTRSDPKRRPNMEEVVQRLEKIRRSLSNRQLRSRIWGADEPLFISIVLSLWHWLWQITYIFRGFASIPPVPPRLQPLSRPDASADSKQLHPHLE